MNPKANGKWKLKEEIARYYHWWMDEPYMGKVSEIQRTGDPKRIINFQKGVPAGLMQDWLALNTPKSFRDTLIEVAHEHWDAGLGYSRVAPGDQAWNPVGGRLKQAIIHREKCVHNVTYDPSNVWPGAGSMPGSRRVEMNIMGPGDEWLVLEPIYEHYWWHWQWYRWNWVPWRQVEEDDWTPDLDMLRSKVTEKTKGILIVNPCNPTGAVFSRKTLKEMCDIAGEHDMVILSDEVQDLLVHNEPHIAPSVAEVAGDVPVFKVDSMSKSMLLPGWRMGWLLLHDPEGKLDEIKKGINKISEIAEGGMCAYSAVATMKVLESITDFTAHLTDVYRIIKKRADYANRRFNEIEGISLVKPKCGYYGFAKVDLGTTWKDDKEWAWQLLNEEAISVIPGSVWGPTYGSGHFRVPLLQPEFILEEACLRLEPFLQKHLG